MDNYTIQMLIDRLQYELEFNSDKDTKAGLIRAIEVLKGQLD